MNPIKEIILILCINPYVIPEDILAVKRRIIQKKISKSRTPGVTFNPVKINERTLSIMSIKLINQ